MMYEEQVKRLRDKASKLDYDGWVDTAASLEEATDTIEALIEVIQNHDFLESVIKPHWIPVTERLPKDLRDVQITVFWHDAWRTMYGYYDGSFWHLYAPMHTEVADVKVIGWMEKPAPMPLPEPPKEE